MANMKLQIVGQFRDLISPKLAVLRKNILKTQAAMKGVYGTTGRQKSTGFNDSKTIGSQEGIGAALGAVAAGTLATGKKIESGLKSNSKSFSNSISSMTSRYEKFLKVMSKNEAYNALLYSITEADLKSNKFSRTVAILGDKIKSSFGGAVRRSINETKRSFSEFFDDVLKHSGKVVAALGALTIYKGFKTVRQFDSLRASLEAVSDTSEIAALNFEFIKNLSKEIPGGIDGLTKSFIKLRALGLSPTEESLISYANTAAAMGKTTNQFVEAIADAVTFEFERLKEFGVLSRQTGSEVTFTFRGVTETVKRSATEVEKYLRKIGNVHFAGAATKQMQTLNGQIEQLNISFAEFSQRFVEETGILSFTKNALNSLIGFGDGAQSIFVKIRLMVASLGLFFDKAFIRIKQVGLDSFYSLSFAIGLIFDGIFATITGTLNGIVKGLNIAITKMNKVPGVNIPLQGEFQTSNFSGNAIKNIADTNADAAEEIKKATEFWDGFADFVIEREMAFKEAEKAGKKHSKYLDELASKEQKIRDAREAEAKRKAKQEEEENKRREARKKALEEYRDRMEQIGQGMQDIFSQFFNDLGNDTKNAFANMAQSFKQMIDQMIADALAAKLMKALFGDLVGAGTAVTNAGGFLGGGAQKAFLSLFGRENGGPVRAGMPYIVGEKRPELFVPDSNGTIIPDLAGMGSTQVNITAIDSKGVADFIEQNKFAFAGAANNVSRRYNLR